MGAGEDGDNASVPYVHMKMLQSNPLLCRLMHTSEKNEWKKVISEPGVDL